MDTSLKSQQDKTLINKIIKYEEGYFDEIFLNSTPYKENIKKYDKRCEKCKKTEDYKKWQNCFNFKNCFPENEKGGMFKNAYGHKNWIPWKT